jgi:hypothetical protein
MGIVAPVAAPHHGQGPINQGMSLVQTF